MRSLRSVADGLAKVAEAMLELDNEGEPAVLDELSRLHIGLPWRLYIMCLASIQRRRSTEPTRLITKESAELAASLFHAQEMASEGFNRILGGVSKGDSSKCFLSQLVGDEDRAVFPDLSPALETIDAVIRSVGFVDDSGSESLNGSDFVCAQKALANEARLADIFLQRLVSVAAGSESKHFVKPSPAKRRGDALRKNTAVERIARIITSAETENAKERISLLGSLGGLLGLLAVAPWAAALEVGVQDGAKDAALLDQALILAGLPVPCDFTWNTEVLVSANPMPDSLADVGIGRFEAFQLLCEMTWGAISEVVAGGCLGERKSSQTLSLLAHGYHLAAHGSSMNHPCCRIEYAALISQFCPDPEVSSLAIELSGLTINGMRSHIRGFGEAADSPILIIRAARAAMAIGSFELVDALLACWVFFAAAFRKLDLDEIENLVEKSESRLPLFRRMAGHFSRFGEGIGLDAAARLESLAGGETDKGSRDRSERVKAMGRTVIRQRCGERLMKMDHRIRSLLYDWGSKQWLQSNPDFTGGWVANNHANLLVELAGIVEQFLRDRLESLPRDAAKILSLRPDRNGLGDFRAAYAVRIDRNRSCYAEIRRTFAGYRVPIETFDRIIQLRNTAAHGAIGRAEFEEFCDLVFGSGGRDPESPKGLLTEFI